MPRIRLHADKYAAADFGSYIKGRMDVQGMTQADLGKELGISQQTVSNMLKHPEKITFAMMRKLFKVLPLEAKSITGFIEYEVGPSGRCG